MNEAENMLQIQVYRLSKRLHVSKHSNFLKINFRNRHISNDETINVIEKLFHVSMKLKLIYNFPLDDTDIFGTTTKITIKAAGFTKMEVGNTILWVFLVTRP